MQKKSDKNRELYKLLESDKIILLTPFLIEKTENNINFIKSIAFF